VLVPHHRYRAEEMAFIPETILRAHEKTRWPRTRILKQLGMVPATAYCRHARKKRRLLAVEVIISRLRIVPPTPSGAVEKYLPDNDVVRCPSKVIRCTMR